MTIGTLTESGRSPTESVQMELGFPEHASRRAPSAPLPAQAASESNDTTHGQMAFEDIGTDDRTDPRAGLLGGGA